MRLAPRLCHSLCTTARVSCTVLYQVDLFTVREKEAKCFATRLRGQDNSLPVVLESYRSMGVFTRRPLLILGMAVIATCSIMAEQWLSLIGSWMCGWIVCVCV